MSDVRSRRRIAGRLRRFAELREGTARRARVRASREVEAAETDLATVEADQRAAEDELLAPEKTLTGADMHLLEAGRTKHRTRRALSQAELQRRHLEHDARVTLHKQAITEQRGKEALEDHAKRALQDEIEKQEARERDELSATRASSKGSEET
jgi:hypothetical protein